jgi:hypothetical protein
MEYMGRGRGSRLPELPKLVIAGIETPEPHGQGWLSQETTSRVSAEIGEQKPTTETRGRIGDWDVG